MRASVGPRIARVHVGNGIGVSSGVGPFTVSSRLTSGRSRRRSSAGGFDVDAFNESMTVSSEERQGRLAREVGKLEKKGWKVEKSATHQAKMVKTKTKGDKIAYIVGTGFGAVVCFVQFFKTWDGGQIAASVVLGFATWYQIYTFREKKVRHRRIEVGGFGAVHKHYHNSDITPE